MKLQITLLLATGLTLIVASTLALRGEGELRHNQNVFAIRQSGYGMILARLSQDTVNKVWHYGIEEVGAEHVHGPDCGHELPEEEGSHVHADHSNHDHDAPADEEEFDHLVAMLDEWEEHDAHEGHDHAPGEACEHDHGAPADEGEFDHLVAMLDEEEEHDAHEGHDHAPGETCEHDHGAEATGEDEAGEGLLFSAKQFLEDLKVASFRRTNPFGLTEAHKQTVARDIEGLLLRSYQMDPTEYGVYNAYYMFLTLHEYRATPASVEQARHVANFTIGMASQERENPFAWLTAASALQDLFFLHQQERVVEGERATPAQAMETRRKIAWCLQQYEQLKTAAIEEDRWEIIGAPRRAEAEERYLFLKRSSEQYDTILGRTAPEAAAERAGS